MTDSDNASCPNGQEHCPIYSQIETLRQKVSELSTQVRTDFLTGLFNKHHLIYSLEQELERTRRTGQPTTLILIDADHFKSVNDTHGHIVGDKVLIHLSRLIKEAVRKIDIPCRFGGEEFAIILPAACPLVGGQVAERIRQSVEGSYITLENDETLRITISLGVTSFTPTDKLSPEQYMKLADEQLYLAKQQGRNRVCQSEHHRSILTTVSSEEKDALFDVLNPPE